MTWNIINTRERRPEAVHHALDQTLLDNMDQGDGEPTLRFWYRKTPAVPLGRFQAYKDEVATDYVEQNDIPVIRRVTGGGAMFVEPGAVITFSMYLPREEVPEDVRESYRMLNQWVIDALDNVGLDAHHEPLNDVSHADGKIGGAAQLRKKNAVLHHATLSYSLNIEEMLRALRIGEKKVSDKAVKSAEKRVVIMQDYIDHDRATVIDEMIAKFKEKYGGDTAAVDKETVDRAEELAEEKFRTDQWNKKL